MQKKVTRFDEFERTAEYTNFDEDGVPKAFFLTKNCANADAELAADPSAYDRCVEKENTEQLVGYSRQVKAPFG